MNDRLKFRAYCKNRFIYKSLCDVNVYTEDGECIRKDDLLPCHLEWQQCTGLSDKNGKLIYEGDIVEYYNEKTGQYIKEKVLPFRELETKGLLRHFISERNSNKLNIVGNIHENKELLDD